LKTTMCRTCGKEITVKQAHNPPINCVPCKDRNRYLERRKDPKFVNYHKEYSKKRTIEDSRKKVFFTADLEERLLRDQDGRCAICRVVFSGKKGASAKYRDHDHVEKKPRGLLCGSCNLCLGHYEKQQKPAGLVIAPYEEYLERGKKH
jgi:hypothetical protein